MEAKDTVMSGDRLLKIRQFKGTVNDYKNYWDDRINRGNI